MRTKCSCSSESAESILNSEWKEVLNEQDDGELCVPVQLDEEHNVTSFFKGDFKFLTYYPDTPADYGYEIYV